ncbi:PREDICTED: uncharacterized protein LOC108555659 [Eufriesea mexicana]|uniref:uncharacterized protein LOC108555659 n=1 Tax=Eufriesea mexicana TaxID=516756 RepID=UPI00083BCABE|nr:PREDICTED: uncharacterized protein LOC108555659 [Eufriesea mexicana]
MQAGQLSDISMKVSIFFLRNIGIWESDDPATRRRMKILLIYTVWNTLLGLITILRDLYFTTLYNGDILYSITTTLTVIMSLFKICIIMKHRGDFASLILYMQQNFWNVKYDFQEKEILNNCKRVCTFFVCSVTTIGICAMVSFIITPLMENMQNKGAERKHPFNLWIKLPVSVTPYYEIIFVVQTISMCWVGICYFCFDNIFCIMAIHLSGQFRILRYRLVNLCDIDHQIREKNTESMLLNQVHKFYEKLKKYIRQHQSLIAYCDKLENVYTMITLGQMVVFSLLICLFGYQVLLAEAPTTRRAIFVFLLIGSMSLLFMITYSCNGVIEHTDNIAIGAYSALWTVMPMNTTGKKLRNDLIMVIVRARRVCCLTANGFFPVSLETYSTILSTAMSYFTLLMHNLENADASGSRKRSAMRETQYNDISLRFSQFLLKLTGVWIRTNDSEKRQRRLATFYTILMAIYAIYLNLSDAYYTWGDFGHCTFLFYNLICITLVMFKILIISIRKAEFKNLILFAQKNFWHFEYDHDEKILFTNCRRFCKLWTITSYFVTQTSLAFYVISPIISNIGKNESERVLPFQIWINLPVNETPYYEIIFVTLILDVQQIGAAYLSNDGFMCVLNMHVICQFQILQHRLLKLWSAIEEQTDFNGYTDSCYTTFKICIRQHQSLIKFCDKLEYVYTLPIFAHVVVFSLLMCLDAYEIILVNITTSMRLIFVFHMIGSLVHILFFTYSCHGLIEESENISMATYSGWWMVLPMTETGKMLRRDIKMMMMKSMRPCYLSAGGFFPVSLETATTLLSSTMSYITLMRESSMGIANE